MKKKIILTAAVIFSFFSIFWVLKEKDMLTIIKDEFQELPNTIDVSDKREFYVGKQKKAIYLTFPATVEPNFIDAIVRIPGEIEKLPTVGTKVKTGDLLAEISNPNLFKELNSAEKEYNKSVFEQKNLLSNGKMTTQEEIDAKLIQEKRELEWTEKELQLNKILYEKGFVSQREVDQSEMKLTNANRQFLISQIKARQDIEKSKVDSKEVNINVISAQSALEEAKRKIGFMHVHSPVDGQVEFNPFIIGKKVTEGQSLLKIRPLLTPSKITITISDFMKQMVADDSEVIIYNAFDIQRKNGFKTRIKSIEKHRKSSSSNMHNNESSNDIDTQLIHKATVYFENHNRFQDGDTVHVDVKVEIDKITVDKDYIIQFKDNYFVFVKKANSPKATQRIVQATPFKDGYLITSGLGIGEILAPIPQNLKTLSLQGT